MGIIGLIIAGLIIGLLGKFVAPGSRDNTPLWLTLLCGVGGVLLGYWISGALGVARTNGVDWVRWLISIIVAAFLVAGQVFHPGDALTVPDEPVATLLLPVHAPWSKLAEVIDYVRAVDADQAYAVHDGALNDIGLGLVGRLLGEQGPGTPTPYSRLAPGDSVEL